jgi:hypothetical protein
VSQSNAHAIGAIGSVKHEDTIAIVRLR